MVVGIRFYFCRHFFNHKYTHTMGEYIKNTKLGTCENLYYTSYPQLKQTTLFNDSEKSGYLKIDSGYRFRFPFTDEKIAIGTHENYDRYILLEIPDNIGVSIMHDKVYQRCGFENGQHKHWQEYGVKFDCPQDDEKQSQRDTKVMRYNNEGKLLLGIIQQKYTTQQGGEKLVTIAICPYCGERCQLDHNEVKAIIQHYEKFENSDDITFILNNLYIAEKGYRL